MGGLHHLTFKEHSSVETTETMLFIFVHADRLLILLDVTFVCLNLKVVVVLRWSFIGGSTVNYKHSYR